MSSNTHSIGSFREFEIRNGEVDKIEHPNFTRKSSSVRREFGEHTKFPNESIEHKRHLTDEVSLIPNSDNVRLINKVARIVTFELSATGSTLTCDNS